MVDQEGNFFHLLVLEAAESLFVGVSTSKFFCMNATALQAIYFFLLFYYFIFPIILQNNHYKYLVSMTQGGCGIPYLSPPVYDYISSGKLPSSIEVDKKNLPNTTLEFILQKVGLFGCTSSVV